MKKLIICTAAHGHMELVEEKDIKAEFERIMTEGYGGDVPAVFHVDYSDGSHKSFTGKDAKHLVSDPNVEEVTVIAPLAGG